MKVVDAGVIVELVANDLDPDALGDEELVAPHLIDSEVTNVLRRLTKRGVLTHTQAADALAGFIDLSITRFPAELAAAEDVGVGEYSLSAYDATYVALAEMVGPPRCSPPTPGWRRPPASNARSRWSDRLRELGATQPGGHPRVRHRPTTRT